MPKKESAPDTKKKKDTKTAPHFLLKVILVSIFLQFYKWNQRSNLRGSFYEKAVHWLLAVLLWQARQAGQNQTAEQEVCEHQGF